MPSHRPRTLVLGTRNHKKRLELEQLLAPYGFQLRTLDEFPGAVEVDETGSTFGENAALKACQQARAIGEWVLAEDSGLAVDALGGAPGIYSARYAGPDATDGDNNAKLLTELSEIADGRRGAHYVCHLTLADRQGQTRLDCEELCRGEIARAPSGTHGFGYDPLFVLPEYHRTFGELGPAVKRALSHRSRAMRRFVPSLLRLVEHVDW